MNYDELLMSLITATHHLIAQLIKDNEDSDDDDNDEDIDKDNDQTYLDRITLKCNSTNVNGVLYTI